MTFRLADPDALYDVPVSIPALAEGGEAPPPMECVVRFRLLPRSETTAAILRGDGPFIRKVVAGWSGIERHDGTPLEYSEENLRLLSDIPHFCVAVSGVYGRWAAGLPGKTSAPSRSTGSGAAATK